MTHLNYADISKASDDELRIIADVRKREAEKRRQINEERAAMLAEGERLREEEASRQRAVDLFPTMAVVTMLEKGLGDQVPNFLSAMARDVSFAQVRKILGERAAAEAQRNRGLVA